MASTPLKVSMQTNAVGCYYVGRPASFVSASCPSCSPPADNAITALLLCKANRCDKHRVMMCNMRCWGLHSIVILAGIVQIIPKTDAGCVSPLPIRLGHVKSHRMFHVSTAFTVSVLADICSLLRWVCHSSAGRRPAVLPLHWRRPPQLHHGTRSPRRILLLHPYQVSTSVSYIVSPPQRIGWDLVNGAKHSCRDYEPAKNKHVYVLGLQVETMQLALQYG